MTAAEAIRDLIAPLLPGWVIQYGRWNDTVEGAKTTRFVVIRPAGGPKADLLRRPEHTVAFISMDGGDILETAAAANAALEAMRTDSGGLVFLQPGEPRHMPTNDGRHVFEMAVSAITH